MNLASLKPASELAQRFGVKSIIYGAPGTAKTPLMATCPNAVALIVEPGMLTMRGETHLQCWQATDVKGINEFFTWIFQSAEAKKFDTVCVDSVSQMAEMILTAELPFHKNKMQAYGELSIKVMGLLEGLFYMPQKHVYLIAKQSFGDENGITVKRPYFPGKDLNIKVPHLYDEVFHIARCKVPGQNTETLAIRTAESFGITARDRSGKLAELEFPHMGQIFTKCMS